MVVPKSRSKMASNVSPQLRFEMKQCLPLRKGPALSMYVLSGNGLHRFLQRMRTGSEEHPIPNVRGLNISNLR